MACKSRDQLVGKRFLSMKCDGTLKISDLTEWKWRCGFVRAVSTWDTNDPNLIVLVDFDDDLTIRGQINVHQELQEFLVEHKLSLVKLTSEEAEMCHWPALSFIPVVDRVALYSRSRLRPLEFLDNRKIVIVNDTDIFPCTGNEKQLITSSAKEIAKAWLDYQAGQSLLLNRPAMLLGYRVHVYRTHGATKWYTAVIKSCNPAQQTLDLTDDTVLQEHVENPTLTQVYLLDDDVVDSILSGGMDVGVAQGRRPRRSVARPSKPESLLIIHFSPEFSFRSRSSTARSAPAKSIGTSQEAPSPCASVTGTPVQESSVQLPSDKSQVTGSSPVAAGADTGKYQRSPIKIRQTVLTTKFSPDQDNVQTPSMWTEPWNVPVKQVKGKRGHTAKKINSKLQSLNLKSEGAQEQLPSKCEDRQEKEVQDVQNAKEGSEVKAASEVDTSAADINFCVSIEEQNRDETKTVNESGDIKTVYVFNEKGDQKQGQSAAVSPVTCENRSKAQQLISGCTKTGINLTNVASANDGVNLELAPDWVHLQPSSDYVNLQSLYDCVTDIEKNSSSGHDSGRCENQVTTKASCVQPDAVNTQEEDPIREALEDQSCAALVESVSDHSDPTSDVLRRYNKKLKTVSGSNQQLLCSPQVPPVFKDTEASCSPANQLTKEISNVKCFLTTCDGEHQPEVVNASARTLPSPVSASSLHDSTSDSRSLIMPHGVNTQEEDPIREALEDQSCAALVESVSDHSDPTSDVLRRYNKKLKTVSGSNQQLLCSPQAPPVFKDTEASCSPANQLTKEISNVKCFLTTCDGEHQPEVVNASARTLPSPVSASSLHDSTSDSRSLIMPHGVSSDRHSAFTSVHPSLPRSHLNTPTGIDHAVSRPRGSLLSIYLSDSKFLSSRMEELRNVKSSPGTGPLIGERMETVNPNPDLDFMHTNLVHSSIMPHGVSSDRHSAYTSVHPSLSRSHLNTPTGIYHAVSRSSGSLLSNYLSDSKFLSSRMEELRNVRSSPGTGPLIGERMETVNPNPDLDLMHTNLVHSHAQNIQNPVHSHIQNITYPVPTHTDILADQNQSTSFSHPIASVTEVLPAQNQASALSDTTLYTGTHSLSASISQQLTLPHGFATEAAERAQQQQQQLAALQQQQQHVMGYALNTASKMAPLVLGQPELPTSQSLPAHCVLKKNSESLVSAEIASAVDKDLQTDHGQRETERAEAERRDILEQKQREKEHMERTEREHQEREREQAEGNKYERAERDRYERQQPGVDHELRKGDYRHNQEQTVYANVDIAAAVDQHFAESLKRLASQQGDTQADGKRLVKANVEESSVATSYPPSSSSRQASSLPQSSHKFEFNLYGYPSSHSTITAEELKQRGLVSQARHVNKEEVLDRNPYSSHATPVHACQPYHLKEMMKDLPNIGIGKSDSKLTVTMDKPVTAHSHHSSPSSLSSPLPHQLMVHVPEHRPHRPLSSLPSSAHHRFQHSRSASTGFTHQSNSEIHASLRSQSPYTSIASQSQPQNYSKSSKSQMETEDMQQQPQPPPAHAGYTFQAYPPIAKSVNNYNLSPQRLVPNPIYSKGGLPHATDSPPLDVLDCRTACASSVNSLTDSKSPQESPKSKRKFGNKDSNTRNKKSKAHPETSRTGHSILIPVTSPQIMPNSPPYTSSSSVSSRSEIGTATSASPVLKSTSRSYSTGFMESNENKAQENVEEDRIQINLSECVGLPEVDLNAKCDHQSDTQPHEFNIAATPSSKQDVSHSLSESYNSRVLETIKKVDNQADTDSDTLSAPSSPPLANPSGTHEKICNTLSIETHHLKKAWLEHFGENLETPVAARDDDFNSETNYARHTGSCVNSLVSPVNECRKISSSPVNVTISSGNELASTSESEMQMSPAFDSKKRVSSNKVARELPKKAKSDTRLHTPALPPGACGNSSSSSSNLVGQQKHAKASTSSRTDRQTKTASDSKNLAKEEQWNISSKPPHSISHQSKSQTRANEFTTTALENSLLSHEQRFDPLPAFSENSNFDVSPSSSSVSALTETLQSNIDRMQKIKDRKKQRPFKEPLEGSKSASSNKLLVMTIATRKETMVPFIQDGPCSDVAPKLEKCRWCKITKSRQKHNIFCRFLGLRRLKYNSYGQLTVEGFSNLFDSYADDIEPWMPSFPVQEPKLDFESAKFILTEVGDTFCELVEQEKQAKTCTGDNVTIVWKRAMAGVPQMCDVCGVTLFNVHWMCHSCAFVACPDCFQKKMYSEEAPDKWQSCTNERPHETSQMRLTQIIPRDALSEVGSMMHDIRCKWSIPSNCSCGRQETDSRITARSGVSQHKVVNEKPTKKPSSLSSFDSDTHSVERSYVDGGAPFQFLHYTPRLGGWKQELPVMVHSPIVCSDVPHSWLCDGRLLHLHDGHHKGNLQIFQELWKRQPVLVSCAIKQRNISLWHPDTFVKEYDRTENEVVNCRNGEVFIPYTIEDFWRGFESLAYRPKDDDNIPMSLKLKDQPPGEDFSKLSPARFHDFMTILPLPEYTHNNKGSLNLASRLSALHVHPNLGPKMYSAYGLSSFPKEGTTNLHLHISDAVNVLVYVGVPGDGPDGRKAQEDAAVKAIDDAGCDNITKKRVTEEHEIPGALWHIYDAHDADKIRDFLNKVAKERGELIAMDHDPIHNQTWYLDKELCDRLLREYGVEGYTIVQCLGDAIFIPAGAPHQVRNLHSCTKVAVGFVSPEHVNQCLYLTRELCQLSKTHSYHEDKLQTCLYLPESLPHIGRSQLNALHNKAKVKNIIYHAVKDAIAVLGEHWIWNG